MAEPGEGPGPPYFWVENNIFRRPPPPHVRVWTIASSLPRPPFSEGLDPPLISLQQLKLFKFYFYRDQGPDNDDYIGTEFLTLSSISGPGAGLGEGEN